MNVEPNVYRYLDALAQSINPKDWSAIRPIPRGGWPVAMALRGALNLPIVGSSSLTPKEGSKSVLWVDDLVDSGRTLARVGAPLNQTAVVFSKPHSPQPRYVGCVTRNSDWIEFPWEQAAGEAPAEDSVVRLLEALGEDPTRPGLVDTPRRMVAALREMTTPEEYDFTTFSAEGMDQMIVTRDLAFEALCEHHILPFSGRATVGYIPGERLVGLSKIARLVRARARSGVTTQERMTNAIAEELNERLSPRGVGVVVEAAHSCMTIRGVHAAAAVTVTSAMRGTMLNDPMARGEILAFAGYGGA